MVPLCLFAKWETEGTSAFLGICFHALTVKPSFPTSDSFLSPLVPKSMSSSSSSGGGRLYTLPDLIALRSSWECGGKSAVSLGMPKGNSIAQISSF